MPDYLPSRVLNQACLRLKPAQWRAVLRRVEELSRRRGLLYNDDRGRPKIIDMTLRPWVLTTTQFHYFTQVAQVIRQALSQLWQLHRRLPEAQQILPLSAGEASWVREATAHAGPAQYVVMGRLDSTAVYHHADWRRRFLCLEPNTVGVGGIHYAPAAQSVWHDAVYPALRPHLPPLRLRPLYDPRLLLAHELKAMLRLHRRRGGHIVLIENQDYKGGTVEFEALARHLTAAGLHASAADPRQLRIKRGEVYFRNHVVDLAYRDSELKEFVEMERDGHDLSAMRRLVREHRVISTATGEFDHKSAWEIFTEPRFARYFTAAQRRLFHDHFLWTRLFRQAKVTSPRGTTMDLIRYTRTHQQGLVLKPNHAYGGEGVTIGCCVTRRVWERTIEQALRGRASYVAQQLAPPQDDHFPVVASNGEAALRRSFVVSGFFVNSTGMSLVGRYSKAEVVNVSRGGGLIAVFEALAV